MVGKWDEHFSLLAALLPQVASDGRKADLVALLDSWRCILVPVMRCFGVVRSRHSSTISSTLGEIISMTGEGFFWRVTLTGSETLRYFLMVLRLTDIWRETERILRPSTKILCLTTWT